MYYLQIDTKPNIIVDNKQNHQHNIPNSSPNNSSLYYPNLPIINHRNHKYRQYNNKNNNS
jgi:hypothetical protein